MKIYYNDNDKKNCAWLRELIKSGLIPAGDVDDRSIADVKASDLADYTSCHFFAGIGGWAYALRLAHWPDERPVWTGSCPCQPFSQAGKGKVDKDERHLWPAFRTLIAQCRPPVCFGEQVASADGRIWLAGVRTDLEGVEYAVGAADLCAAGVSAPHIRQRLYWVADGVRHRWQDRHANKTRQPNQSGHASQNSSGGLGESNSPGRQPRSEASTTAGHGCSSFPAGGPDGDSGPAHCHRPGRKEQRGTEPNGKEFAASECLGQNDRLANATGSEWREETEGREYEPDRPNPGREEAPSGSGFCGQTGHGLGHTESQRESAVGTVHGGTPAECDRSGEDGLVNTNGYHRHWWSGALQVGWNAIESEIERGGRKHRAQWRIKPGVPLLAHGVPGRVAQLRGFGNAIVPQVAAEFIRSYLDL